MKNQKFSGLDNLIVAFDSALKNLHESDHNRGARDYPAADQPEAPLSVQQKQEIAALMRVNHAGEIAAQALYKAQSLTADSDELKQDMMQSADEEIDHLDWCEARLRELDDHPSYLQPLWYAGSFGIGLIAGSFGDKWNLGFLAETEYQVVRHLDKHLLQIPADDTRTRAILEQMRTDELKHATTAEHAGANELPKPIKRVMSVISKVMTKTAYRI